jgi:hypothetical protein
MGQPFPPAGAQTQHTERPLKVYAEQYLAGGSLPVGVVINPGTPPLFSDGQPRVLLPTGWVVVSDTDWVISNRYSGAAVEVLSHDEMAERFGTTAEDEGAP